MALAWIGFSAEVVAASSLEETRAELSERAASDRLPPGWIDIESLASELQEVIPEGTASAVARQQLDRAYERAKLRFLESGATHAPGAWYRVPFDTRFPRLCSQGFNGDKVGTMAATHVGAESHAVDFVLPAGEDVVAARPGEVALVIDGFEAGVNDRRGNSVWIRHDDGTAALYHHLEKGAVVAIGDRVKRGQRIGRSGWSGTEGPHLHFAVFSMGTSGHRSLRIAFGRRNAQPPRAGKVYSRKVAAKVPLRATVGAQTAGSGQPISMRRGESAQVRIERKVNGQWIPVDDRAALQMSTLIPNAVDVDEDGVVRADPAEGFPFEQDRGTIRVIYQQGGTTGFVDIPIHIHAD